MTGLIPLWYAAPTILAGLVFWRRPELRRPMIWGGSLAWPILLIKPLTSVGFFPLLTTAQLSEFFLARAVVVFALGALSAALYEACLARHFVRGQKQQRHYLFYLGVGPVIFLLLFLTFQLPFASSLTLAILVNLVILLVSRRDLVWDAAFAGLFFAALYGVIFIVAFNSIPGDTRQLWFSGSLSGLTLLGLPIEELTTALFFGLLWGPLYVALKGIKEKER